MIRHMVAVDAQRGIARQGAIPWNLPTDRQYCRNEIQKYGGLLVMGRKTFEQDGDWFKDLRCFVLTRNPNYLAAGATVITNLDELISTERDIWIIGGSEVYGLTLPLADELYITEIEHDYDCDTFYPAFAADFTCIRAGDRLTENGVSLRFKVYRPNSK